MNATQSVVTNENIFQQKILQIGNFLKQELQRTLTYTNYIEKNSSQQMEALVILEGILRSGDVISKKKKVKKNIEKKSIETHNTVIKIPKTFSPLKKACTTPVSTSSCTFEEEKLLQRKRESKKILNCPHENAKHYAKGMCSNCYHSKGRKGHPWNCKHRTRALYAHGLCQNCYHVKYVRSKKESKKKDKNFSC